MHKEDDNSPLNIMCSEQSSIIKVLKEEFAKNLYLIQSKSGQEKYDKEYN